MSIDRVLERIPSTWRLAVLQGVLVLGSIALCVAMTGWALQKDLQRIASAVVLDDLGEYAVLYARGGWGGIAEMFAAGAHDEKQAVRITGRDGRVLFEQIPATAGGFAWPTAGSVASGHSPLQVLHHPERDQCLLVGTRELADGNVLWFGRLDEEDRAYLSHVRATLFLAGSGAALLSLLPLGWFWAQVLRPVQRMMAAAKTLAEGRTNAPMTAPGGVPELRAFAVAYNEGLRRIENLTGELRNANDNLAHEIRTPLARIRGNLEGLLDATDRPEARDAAARSLEEIDRATKLVHNILTIRGAEHQALQLYRESVDLRDLLALLREIYLPAAGQLGLALYVEASQPVVVEVDQVQVNQALSNLLDNALSYTPAGGSVGLELERRADFARITVNDTGPGVAPAEMERIWERHARGSAAGKHATGIGLGLSLVRAIAIAHGGRSGCQNRPTRGASFWVELPLPWADSAGS